MPDIWQDDDISMIPSSKLLATDDITPIGTYETKDSAKVNNIAFSQQRQIKKIQNVHSPLMDVTKGMDTQQHGIVNGVPARQLPRMVTIRAERHSGTKLARAVIQNNALGLADETVIPEPDGIYGWKHGFLRYEDQIRQDDILLVMSRDVFTWLPAMVKLPYKTGAADPRGANRPKGFLNRIHNFFHFDNPNHGKRTDPEGSPFRTKRNGKRSELYIRKSKPAHRRLQENVFNGTGEVDLESLSEEYSDTLSRKEGFAGFKGRHLPWHRDELEEEFTSQFNPDMRKSLGDRDKLSNLEKFRFGPERHRQRKRTGQKHGRNPGHAYALSMRLSKFLHEDWKDGCHEPFDYYPDCTYPFEEAENIIQLRTAKYKNWLGNDTSFFAFNSTFPHETRSFLQYEQILKFGQEQAIGSVLRKHGIEIKTGDNFEEFTNEVQMEGVRRLPKNKRFVPKDKMKILEKFYSLDDLRYILDNLDLEFERNVLKYSYNYVLKYIKEKENEIRGIT